MKTVLVLSGGMDSVTLLHHLVKNEGHSVLAISFDYGQKHAKELRCAASQCEILGVRHQIISLDFLKKLVNSTLLKSGNEVPTGHYEHENMKATVVPNRNMIMASIATSWAISERANAVALGVHAGDHTIYPDCRAAFITALSAATQLCDYHPVEVISPFQELKKADILRIGIPLGVDYKNTWTCYFGQKTPQYSGATVERAEAFLEVGVSDPLFSDSEWDKMQQYLKKLKQNG